MIEVRTLWLASFSKNKLHKKVSTTPKGSPDTVRDGCENDVDIDVRYVEVEINCAQHSVTSGQNPVQQGQQWNISSGMDHAPTRSHTPESGHNHEVNAGRRWRDCGRRPRL